MAGDILFYAIAIGKEGFATWWCNWCKLFKPEWQAVDYQVGVPWTMDALQENATKIESGLVNLNSVHAMCVVKKQPLFDAIDTDHFIPPVLHLTIGKGNNVLQNMPIKLQAAGEAYSLDYYKREKDTTNASLNLEKAKEELQQFNDGNIEYETDLRFQKRRRGEEITEQMKEIAEAELDNIALD
jgi:hypothetical protein